MPVRSGRDATLNFDKMAKQIPVFVSSLPTQAADGAEVYYQNLAMSEQGVVWHLRYRAASTSPYKWEFIGGSEIIVSVGGERKITLASPAFVFQEVTGSPSLTTPLAGDYFVTQWIEYIQLAKKTNAAVQLNTMAGFSPTERIGLDIVLVVAGATVGPPETSNQFTTVGGQATGRANGLTAATAIKLFCAGNNATAELWQMGALLVGLQPIRVG